VVAIGPADSSAIVIAEMATSTGNCSAVKSSRITPQPPMVDGGRAFQDGDNGASVSEAMTPKGPEFTAIGSITDALDLESAEREILHDLFALAKTQR